MTIQKQLGFWIAALVAFVLFLWLFSGISAALRGRAGAGLFSRPRRHAAPAPGAGTARGNPAHPQPVRHRLRARADPSLFRWQCANSMPFLQMLPSYVGQLQRLAYEHGGPLLEMVGGAEAGRDIESSLRDMAGNASGYLLDAARLDSRRADRHCCRSSRCWS